jgi:hypothetical protein
VHVNTEDVFTPRKFATHALVGNIVAVGFIVMKFDKDALPGAGHVPPTDWNMPPEQLDDDVVVVYDTS